MLLTRLHHERLGACELLRIEGLLWVVRQVETGELFRIPSERRREFRVVPVHSGVTESQAAPNALLDATQTKVQLRPQLGIPLSDQHLPAKAVSEEGSAPRPHLLLSNSTNSQNDPVSTELLGDDESEPASSEHSNCHVATQLNEVLSDDPRKLRRAFESFRSGLPTTDGCGRRLAMGFAATSAHLDPFLEMVSEGGGGSLVIRGQYGQGKTYSLQLLEAMALDAGFVTVRAEVDAFENRLDRPHCLYRDLMRRMRVPGGHSDGVETLARLTDEHLGRCLQHNSHGERLRWLNENAQCIPLAWLMSDPSFLRKPELLGLLKNDLVKGFSQSKRAHANLPGGSYWPLFRYGTQADFACLILSSFGRLSRSLGFRGILILLDEMEKWQDLRWQEQIRAGSLVGGLIWGASAAEGYRSANHEPSRLIHSGANLYDPSTGIWSRFDFTTRGRCHLGLAIAITPRDAAEDPTEYWTQFGTLKTATLPILTDPQLREYCSHIAPHYSLAYATPLPTHQKLLQLANETCARWHLDGQLTMRSGVQAAVGVFDNWRDQLDTGGTSV